MHENRDLLRFTEGHAGQHVLHLRGPALAFDGDGEPVDVRVREAPILARVKSRFRWRGRACVAQREQRTAPLRQRRADAGWIGGISCLIRGEACGSDRRLVRGFSGELTMLVETAGDPGALAGAFRQTVHSIDKNVSPLVMSTLKETLRQGLYEREMTGTFMGAFGLLGLMLAFFGLYGIVSYTFSQRTREIGLRMALGAQRSDALRMVLRHGLRLALKTGCRLPELEDVPIRGRY